MVTGYECVPLIVPSLDVENASRLPSPQSMVTFHGASWSGSLKAARSSVKSRPTAMFWSGPAVTTGGAVQVSVNGTWVVLPAITATVRDGPPVTKQFGATPDSATVWLPELKSGNVALPLLVAIGWLWAPSTVTV